MSGDPAQHHLLNRFNLAHLRFSVKGNLEGNLKCKKFFREYYLYINGFL